MLHPIKAAKTIVIILLCVLVFHLLVLTGIIPFTIVWGGRLKTKDDMLRFETVSIAINLLLTLIAAVRAQWLRLSIPPGLLRAGLWLMAALFLLNTVGNTMATTRWEQFIFTPVTSVLAILCLLAARGIGKTSEASIQ